MYSTSYQINKKVWIVEVKIYNCFIISKKEAKCKDFNITKINYSKIKIHRLLNAKIIGLIKL
jgi:hypothetical protein